MAQRWIALFEDIEDGAAIRAEFVLAHQAFLRKHKGIITLCGALRPEPDAKPVGGMWVFEGVSRAEVDAIVNADPFYANGLRSSYKLLAWGVAPGFETMVITESA